MAPLRLSIVIPTHNTRDLTLACLGSLADGGVPEVEVLVVDDGSGDRTTEAVEAEFPSVRVLRHERATGFSAAANRGATEAGGEVILFLNSDTEVEPDALLELSSAFASDPDLGIAGATLHFPDGRPQWSAGPEPGPLWLFGLASGLPALLHKVPGYRLLRQGGPTAPDPARSLPVDWVTGAALAVRREVWEGCGPFEESYRFYCQDLDLCTTARAAGWQVARLPAFRVMHHHGATIAPGGEAGRNDGQRTAAGQDILRLWADLVTWTAKTRGRPGARKAIRALTWGGRLRLAGRALKGPFVRREGRAAFRAESAAYGRALEHLRSGPLP